MSGKNIEDFNLLLLAMLGYLYSEFPKQVTMHPDEIELPTSLIDAYSSIEDDEFSEFWNGTYFWAKDEGFIRTKQEIADDENDCIYPLNATLTLRALEVLNQTPEALDGESSLGQQITSFVKDELKTGSREVVRRLSRQLITTVISAAS